MRQISDSDSGSATVTVSPQIFVSLCIGAASSSEQDVKVTARTTADHMRIIRIGIV
jgi:hypothetical protein